jgi:hypothetical protein
MSCSPSSTSKYLLIDKNVINRLIDDDTSTANFSTTPDNNSSTPTATSLPRDTYSIDNSLLVPLSTNGCTATYTPNERGVGKRKRRESRNIEDDVQQEGSQQKQHQLVSIGPPTTTHSSTTLEDKTGSGSLKQTPAVHPTVYNICLVEMKKGERQLEKGTSILLTTTSATQQLDTPFEDLYSSCKTNEVTIGNKSPRVNHLQATYRKKGGLLMTFITGTMTALRYVSGLSTIEVDEDKSPNPLYSIKIRGKHTSKDADAKTPKLPTEEPFNEEGIKTNIKFLLRDPLSKIHGWLKLARASLHVWCHYEHGDSFTDAINQSLTSAHVDGGMPLYQLDKLPAKTTDKIWIKLEVTLLQKIGVRVYAWADLEVFIIDHLENLVLKGITSVAGGSRNDWDLPNDTDPPFEGISKHISREDANVELKMTH